MFQYDFEDFVSRFPMFQYDFEDFVSRFPMFQYDFEDFVSRFPNFGNLVGVVHFRLSNFEPVIEYLLLTYFYFVKFHLNFLFVLNISYFDFLN